MRAKPSLSLSSHAVAPQLTIGNPPEINTKKNTRPHRALERGLDWLLWVYRTVWPLVALAVVARLTSPPPQAQEAGIPEEEGEEGMEGYYGFGEEQQQQLGSIKYGCQNIETVAPPLPTLTRAGWFFKK